MILVEALEIAVTHGIGDFFDELQRVDQKSADSFV